MRCFDDTTTPRHVRKRDVMKSPVLENCPPGSVRGASGDRRPYLDLAPVARCFPNVETLGYYRMSLRDKDSDTFSKSLPRSNPSGIGGGALRSARN